MNEEFNKDIETLTKNQIEILEMKTSIKNSVENFANTMKQVENRVLGLKIK
jgi:hypothetical protein